MTSVSRTRSGCGPQSKGRGYAYTVWSVSQLSSSRAAMVLVSISALCKARSVTGGNQCIREHPRAFGRDSGRTKAQICSVAQGRVSSRPRLFGAANSPLGEKNLSRGFSKTGQAHYMCPVAVSFSEVRACCAIRRTREEPICVCIRSEAVVPAASNRATCSQPQSLCGREQAIKGGGANEDGREDKIKEARS